MSSDFDRIGDDVASAPLVPSVHAMRVDDPRDLLSIR